jgi:hypothetical protein
MLLDKVGMVLRDVVLGRYGSLGGPITVPISKETGNSWYLGLVLEMAEDCQLLLLSWSDAWNLSSVGDQPDGPRPVPPSFTTGQPQRHPR